MVENAKKVQGDSDLEDQLQRFQHPLRQMELDSSNLLVVSDKSIHIVLEKVDVNFDSLKAQLSFSIKPRR